MPGFLFGTRHRPQTQARTKGLSQHLNQGPASCGRQDGQLPETHPRLRASPLTLPAPQPPAPGSSSISCPHFFSCLSLPLSSDSLPFAYTSLSTQTPLSPASLGGNAPSSSTHPSGFSSPLWGPSLSLQIGSHAVGFFLISWESPNSPPPATNSNPYTPDCFKYGPN